MLSSFSRSAQEQVLMAEYISIRNLTGTPLTVTLIERFRSPNADSSVLSNVTNLGRNLANFTLSTAVAPSGQQLQEHAVSFFQRDVNIRIEPFTISRTDLKSPKRVKHEIMRLTIAANDEKYRMDCPFLAHLSQTLHPLSPDPKFEFTAVYLSHHAFICIYNSANLDSWQQHLHGATPFSALSIPGTHNSPTCHNALPSVRCQSVSPYEQLNNGVRFFDIRVQVEALNSSKLILVHGVFPIKLTGTSYFRDLEQTVSDFLTAHPSESVIISLKREGTGDAKDADLARILLQHYVSDTAPHGRKWYTDPEIPTLGQCRGKMVLLRRFRLDDTQRSMNNDRGFGIMAAAWADNTPHDLQDFVCVQDFYEVLETENIGKKLKYAVAHCERAGDIVCQLPGITTDKEYPAPRQPFYINFLSGSNFWKVGCWPEKVAAKLNPGVLEHICLRHHLDGEREKEGDGATGIIVLDWVGGGGDWDIVRCIVGCNSRLMVREMEMK